MARYEHTRTYVVVQILRDTVVFKAPKGRSYNSLEVYTNQLSNRTIKALKFGKKVLFTRFSSRYSTWYAPKA
jgi:hypothetical protein